MDQRISKLAEILVDYSTKVKKGDNVYLLTNSFETFPLVEEVYRLVIQRGAYPYPHIGLDPNVGLGAFDYIFMKYASEEQLKHTSEIALNEMKNTDVYIRIGGETNTRELTNIDPERMALRKKATDPILNERMKKRWVLTRYPTRAFAQEADMSLKEFEDFAFDACLLDWKKESDEQDKIKKIFDGKDEVRIVGEKTDLRFSIKGRMGTKCDGKYNMPDGEIFYAPVEDSAEGKISYSYPTIYENREIAGIVLEFKNGRVVSESATKNEDSLRAALNTDSDARLIGEFGIGTNYKITRYVKNILFDEKIGGTIHLAVGMAYEGSGGKSKSAIHWDMIKDLRDGGAIYVDGELVQKNGKFLV